MGAKPTDVKRITVVPETSKPTPDWALNIGVTMEDCVMALMGWLVTGKKPANAADLYTQLTTYKTEKDKDPKTVK